MAEHDELPSPSPTPTPLRSPEMPDPTSDAEVATGELDPSVEVDTTTEVDPTTEADATTELDTTSRYVTDATRVGPSTPSEPTPEVDADDGDRTALGEELLQEANRLRYGPPLVDTTAPITEHPPHQTGRRSDERWSGDRPVAPITPLVPPRQRDPGALLVGAWFAVAGVVTALLGENRLDDVPPVIVPISFAVVGLGLLLPKRPVRTARR